MNDYRTLYSKRNNCVILCFHLFSSMLKIAFTLLYQHGIILHNLNVREKQYLHDRHKLATELKTTRLHFFILYITMSCSPLSSYKITYSVFIKMCL